MKVLLCLLFACKTSPPEAHIAAVCSEGLGSGHVGSGSDGHPCDMNQGQIRQWLSDNAATTRLGWMELVAKADTVKKLTTFWSCRHDDGSSDYNWGVPLAKFEPGGWCFQVFDHKWIEKQHHRQLSNDEELRTYGMKLGPPSDGLCPPPEYLVDAGPSKLLHEKDAFAGYVFEGRTLDCPDWK